MPNTSATGGFITPSSSPAPLEGEALQDFFQAWIVGLTGLAPTLVRPRWQPDPPNIPTGDIDWVGFGITSRSADVFAAELHYPNGDGYDQIRRHEVLNLLASFYGPNADTYAHLLREGMQLGQNREILSLNSMGLVESGDITAIPELLKDKWLYRVDFPFSIRRQIVRNYAIQNLLSAEVSLDNEISVESIIVTN